jgi:hypothetical protein
VHICVRNFGIAHENVKVITKKSYDLKFAVDGHRDIRNRCAERSFLTSNCIVACPAFASRSAWIMMPAVCVPPLTPTASCATCGLLLSRCIDTAFPTKKSFDSKHQNVYVCGPCFKFWKNFAFTIPLPCQKLRVEIIQGRGNNT